MLGHRLVVDIQTTQNVRYSERGIPRYASEFARALLRAGAPVAGLALNPSLSLPRRLHPEVRHSPKLCWNTARTFRRLCAEGPVAYHILSTLEAARPVQSTLPPYALDGGIPLVCTVYDFVPERIKIFEPGSPFGRLYELRREMLRRADLIFAISQATRDDALELLGVHPDRVVEVGTGASEFFQQPSAADRPGRLVARSLPDIDRSFVLAVTGVFGLDARKNTDGLIEAFASLPRSIRDDHQLVVTCQFSAEDRLGWLELASDHGMSADQLVLTGFVPDTVLRALYQEATLFVNPSLYEGFGLPTLEAARCGCPTITSNTSALPEVLSCPSATFDPTSSDELASLMSKALTDTAFRAVLREAAAAASQRHTWERVAAKALAGYGRLDPVPRRRRRRTTPRIALVGPMPPVTSDTATYNGRLAPVLAERCHLDCFAEGEVDRSDRVDRQFRIFPAGAFGRILSATSYDAIFYTLGTGREHDQTFELALRYPGIVWLHEVNLADLYLQFAHLNFPADKPKEHMTITLRQHYGERAPEHLIDSEVWASPPAYEAVNARLSAELSAESRGVIVSSDRARSVLEFDSGPYIKLPRTWVVPLAGMPAAPPDDGAVGGGEGVPLVLCLGDPGPETSVLLEAVSIVNITRPARLAVLGLVEDGQQTLIRGRAAALGLAALVEVGTGNHAESRQALLRQATCAVLLRSDPSGAASVAVADAVAHGIPTLTSLGACVELPPGTVEMLPAESSAPDLAREIRHILDEPRTRERLRRGALAFARSWTLDDVVDSILEITRWDAAVSSR